MKRILTILFVLFIVKGYAQVANAGADHTIYLKEGNHTTVGGISSGTSFLWTKINDIAPPQAGYPYDSSTIDNPTSAITGISNMIQGTWYYQLAATTGATTVKDTVIIRVDYDYPPDNTNEVFSYPMNDTGFVNTVNWRKDTTEIGGYTTYPNKYVSPKYGTMYIERSRANGATIDSSRGKLYQTLEDGYEWNGDGYARSQLNVGGYLRIDTMQTYIVDLKFYFPQPLTKMDSLPTWGTFAIFGIHEYDGLTGTGEIIGKRDSLYWFDNSLPSNKQYTALTSTKTSIMGQAHTFRITIRQGKGYVGQDAFMKVEFDGVQKSLRDTGTVGRIFNLAYLKLGGLYDYGQRLVNIDSLSRGRKFSIANEHANVYTIAYPIVKAGADTSTANTSITLNGKSTPNPDRVATYLWTKISGPGLQSISSNTTLTPTVNGLQAGDYVFRMQAQDSNSGNYSDVNIHVTPYDVPISSQGKLKGKWNFKNK